MVNNSSEQLLTPREPTRGPALSTHLTALTMFLIFALGLVTPALLAGPPTAALEDELSSSNSSSTLDSGGQGNTDASQDSNDRPSQFCASALAYAKTIKDDYLDARNGSKAQLQTLSGSIDSEIGSFYTGRDSVRQAMAAINTSAKRATSPQRTAQELTAAGLSASLNRPSTVDAVNLIFAKCN
jgi:hypothetical protein